MTCHCFQPGQSLRRGKGTQLAHARAYGVLDAPGCAGLAGGAGHHGVEENKLCDRISPGGQLPGHFQRHFGAYAFAGEEIGATWLHTAQF